MGPARVVITGIGVLAANGNGIVAFWDATLKGRSGIDKISFFDASDYPVSISGEVSNFELSEFVDNRFKAKRLGRNSQLALAATQMAVADAGLDHASLAVCAPIDIAIGISTSAMDVVARGKTMLDQKGPCKISPYIVSESQPNAVAAHIAELLDVETHMLTIATACPAGIDAISMAAQLIREGRGDIAITGGADAPTDYLSVALLANSGLVPDDRGEVPQSFCRPFDRDRRGGIIAEGAAIFVLENYEAAKARGARIYAEILGHGTVVDRVGGGIASGLEISMRMALANSRLNTDRVDYICAHAPSDRLLDRVETDMIKKVFGSKAYRIPVSSIKGVIGSPLAGAAPLAMAASALALHDGLVPPTANYRNRDPDCDLDYVPLHAREIMIQTAIINCHGLGGGNTTLVLRRAT